MSLFDTFKTPPRDYTLIPFWFLNDELDEAELTRQLDDFRAHGVYGVVPHARIGLSKDIGFMSDRWLHFVAHIVEYAAANGMRIILYDEGMYPSGSCAGQVVAANPRHATRCLEKRWREEPGPGEELVYAEGNYRFVNAPSGGHIRGVHFGEDDNEPGAPPSGDILNPESVASFLHLVNDRYYDTLAPHFGKTIIGIFTDEPDKLGRGHKKNVMPWTWGFEKYLEASLGYDFRPYLLALFDEKFQNRERFIADFNRAVNARLEESFYKPYSEWCAAHGVALTGHPAGPMDMGTEKYFHIPGQDVVWRYLEPFQDKSLEGEQSTMGKCSSSAKAHYGRARNLNECFGAYGWNFTYDEMRWVTNWLLVRGVDLLTPHAFYYSIRGPRRDERPPDAGPNNSWWPNYKTYADYCRRMCWLIGEGAHVCDTAILGAATRLPWRAARALFERQRDFNYLDADTLAAKGTVTADGISIAGMTYRSIIVDGPEILGEATRERLAPMIASGRALAYLDTVEGLPAPLADGGALAAALEAVSTPDVRIAPANKDIRYRHMRHGGAHFYFFVNEGKDTADVSLDVSETGRKCWLDPATGERDEHRPADKLTVEPYSGAVLCVET